MDNVAFSHMLATEWLRLVESYLHFANKWRLVAIF